MSSMMQRVLSASVAMLMVSNLAMAAEAAVVKTNWSGFQKEVRRLNFHERGARISLVSGGEIKVLFMRVEDQGIVVRLNRATSQWKSGAQEATVPRDAVAGVRFSGKIGKKGLIGGLVGLGLGALTAGLSVAGDGGNCEGGACGAGLVLIPLGAVGGYLLGYAKNRPAPVFVIE